MKHLLIIVLSTLCSYNVNIQLPDLVRTNNSEHYTLKESYNKGIELFSKRLYKESLFVFFAAEKLAIKLDHNEYYGLIQYRLSKFPKEFSIETYRQLYYKNQVYKLEKSNDILTRYIYSLFFIMLLLIISLLYYFLENKKKVKIILGNTIQQLNVLQEEINDNKKEISETQKKTRELLKIYFSDTDKIVKNFYQYGCNTKVIEKEIKLIINKVRNNNAIEEIKLILNKYNCDIIEKLQLQIKTLTDNDITFFTLFATGMSNISISFLTERPISYVYNQRSRLKKIIKSSRAIDAISFLEVLK